MDKIYIETFVKAFSTIILGWVAYYAILQGGYTYKILISLFVSLAIYEISLFSKCSVYSLIIIPFAVTLLMFYPHTFLIFYIIPVIGLIFLKKNKFANTFYLVILMICSIYFITLRDSGKFFVILILLVAVLTDIGGFFFGKVFGGKKIWQDISPNKTWSGAIGGWFLSLLGGISFFNFYYTDSWYLLKTIILIFLMSLCSQIGDMFESYLKRVANVKDSSKLIPGHGGVLDRLDSVIGATIFFMVYYSYAW